MFIINRIEETLCWWWYSVFNGVEEVYPYDASISYTLYSITIYYANAGLFISRRIYKLPPSNTYVTLRYSIGL